MALAAIAQRCLELTQDIFLRITQAYRRFDHHVTVQVARIRTTHPFDALATQAEGLARLRTLGDADLGLAIQGRNLDVATQRCRRKRYGQFTVQIIRVALENLVFLDVNLNEQIA